jgi:thermitase
MRRYSGLLATASVALLIGLGIQTGQFLSQPNIGETEPEAHGSAFAPGRILVKLKEGAPADAIESLNRKYATRVEEKIPHLQVSVVDLPKDLSVTEAVERYEASPHVRYAEPDYIMYPAMKPNDPAYSKMSNLNNTRQDGGILNADIDAPEAWGATTGGSGTVVAVIDTGVDITHPDLRDNIWTNPDEIPNNNKDDDNNGYKDDVHGWDFCHDDASVFDSPSEDGHGTHVAGTIAAEGNNGIGITGVSWRAKIMPLKFICPNNEGAISDAARAIDYAVAEGVKISNNSYGWYIVCSKPEADACSPPLRTLHEAIARADDAGHLFVTAAMNGGADYIGDNNDSKPIYPSSFDDPNIISVAASNTDDELTSFSNYSDTSVDLAAPGKPILSTKPGNAYSYGEGTSVAVPHVAGVAALIKSKFPNLDDAGIKRRILEGVDKKAALKGKTVTGGRLSAARALGRNTAPFILDLRPSKGSKLRDRTPTIQATVRDDETDLTKSSVLLYLDGNRIDRFSFDPARNRLEYTTGKLSTGRWHQVKIVVRDGQGLSETRTSRFEVVR